MTGTLTPYGEQWLAQLEREGKSPHTLKAYRLALQHFGRWSRLSYSEAFDPTQTIPRDIRDWKSHQQTVEKAAPSTVNQRLVALSSIYKWAVEQGLMSRDPTAGVKNIRLARRQPQSLPYPELRKLLREVSKSGKLRDIAILELLAGTGIRVGELLQLQVGDVVAGERAGRVTIREGKHGSYREIPLTKDPRGALRKYLEQHPQQEESGAPLWLGKHGALTHRSSVLRILNKYTLRSGLGPIGPHVLRHTFATLYLKSNPDDLRGLAALLGHSDLNTVMVYTEPTLDDLAQRMERTETPTQEEA